MITKPVYCSALIHTCIVKIPSNLKNSPIIQTQWAPVMVYISCKPTNLQLTVMRSPAKGVRITANDKVHDTHNPLYVKH